jgi:putative transposase
LQLSFLLQALSLNGGGRAVHPISWKKVYAGMGVSEIRRLKQLEDENAKLKRVVADLTLDKAMLQDVLRKMYGPPRRCKGFGFLSGAVCVNVSGLSRVSCCCSQAMMRCAPVVPNKSYGP